MREVEWETLKWLDWHNNRRLLGPIGDITPAEAEEAFCASLNSLDMLAASSNNSPSGKAGAVQIGSTRPVRRLMATVPMETPVAAHTIWTETRE